ncbi:hypothetical protein Tco_1494932, partial [Tanacetum coccineum]
VSSFDLEAYSDSDYAGANLDRKSTTREYVAAANCYGQNPVFHSKTKHIKIRHHFIRDAYEKKLIQVLKIHTDDNVRQDGDYRVVVQFVDEFHNILACLEKIAGNSEFHEIVDFLTSSLIHHALTQGIIVTEESIRSSLLLNDADGTACLTNEAIFQNLALMGYEGELNKLTFQKALFSPQ